MGGVRRCRQCPQNHFFSVVVSVLLLLTALLPSATPFGIKITGDSTYVISNIQNEQKIVFSIDKTTYSKNETVKFTIHNKSSSTIFFGASFSIEKYVRGKWKSLEFPEDVFFTLIGHELLVGGTFEGGVKIELLNKGNYRIIKGIPIDDDPADDVFLISEVFYVK